VLLASIHDVSPRFEEEVDRFADLIGERTGTGRFAMLVVPDHWGAAPIVSNAAFRRKLRAWSDCGIEMFVHGWFHRDSDPRGFAARHMTAGEGEFSSLDKNEALRRMGDGKALVEDCIGRNAAGFVAPAWLYSAGAREALREAGFEIAEDHFKVWQPTSQRQLCKGPVITWATRTRWRKASSIVFAAAGRRFLSMLPVVRLAVHPADAGHPATLRSIGRALDFLLERRKAGRYSDLLHRRSFTQGSGATPEALAGNGTDQLGEI